jgi:hypothetical protein
MVFLETRTDGMRTDFLVRGDSVFWIHVPELFRTFYFRASSRDERDGWVSAINHNLEHIRCEKMKISCIPLGIPPATRPNHPVASLIIAHPRGVV